MSDFYDGTLELQDGSGTTLATLTGEDAVVAYSQYKEGATRLTVVDSSNGVETNYELGQGCVCRVVFTPSVNQVADPDCEEPTC